MSLDDEKRLAAIAAVDLVQDGMVLGLGTGSTAAHAVRALGERVRAGLKIVGVPTSEATARLARELGIELRDLDAVGQLDLTIDGTDEIDGNFHMIKGGGAALLREKLVASASTQVAIIADSTKRVKTLGRFALPIEIIPFGSMMTIRRISTIAAPFGLPKGALARRCDPTGAPLVTDQGNHILDASFGAIHDPRGLGLALDQVVGVVDHGLFLDLATTLFVGQNSAVTRFQKGDPV
jgi:ribose 5-phosphate isomerase A